MAYGSTATNVHLIKPGAPITIRDPRVPILSGGERYTLAAREALHR